MSLDQNTVLRILMRERVRLYAYTWSIVRDQHLAEDVFQEVSILVMDKREELRDAAALPTWLLRASRHKALQAARSRRRDPLVFDEAAMQRLDRLWEKRDDVEDTIAALRQCLSELTPYARRIVQLRYAEGLSGEALARKLDRKVRTTYMALTRIHNALAECVQRRMRQGGADA
ncbi:MAG: sigma-70 family RNA polymerase sigma factor [Planctomycetes bacterium]|nr:sigma-70 family RNA polymerase sigma factor [Planctomycetota bacterium]